MEISERAWRNYINGLDWVDKRVKASVLKYLETNEVDSPEGRNAFITFCYGLVTKYGEAATEFACEMYDAISELEGADVPLAMPAETATYSDVAKAVNGTMKNVLRAEIVAAAMGRLVKLAGQDTTLQNAIRDKAYFAWIPLGDTCPFCLSIAAEGWKVASERALSGGHAEHIHGNCNCSYSIKHKENTSYPFYDPAKYQLIFENAEGDTEEEKLNSVRRIAYNKNKDKINAQKRSAYERTKELNSSEAEEIDVN